MPPKQLAPLLNATQDGASPSGSRPQTKNDRGGANSRGESLATGGATPSQTTIFPAATLAASPVSATQIAGQFSSPASLMKKPRLLTSLATSPGGTGCSSAGVGGGLSLPTLTSAEAACRALKYDIVSIQNALDDLPSDASNPGALKIRPTLAMRQLEGELFAVDALPTHEVRLAPLIELLSKRIQQWTSHPHHNGGGSSSGSTFQQSYGEAADGGAPYSPTSAAAGLAPCTLLGKLVFSSIPPIDLNALFTPPSQTQAPLRSAGTASSLSAAAAVSDSYESPLTQETSRQTSDAVPADPTGTGSKPSRRSGEDDRSCGQSGTAPCALPSKAPVGPNDTWVKIYLGSVPQPSSSMPSRRTSVAASWTGDGGANAAPTSEPPYCFLPMTHGNYALLSQAASGSEQPQASNASSSAAAVGMPALHLDVVVGKIVAAAQNVAMAQQQLNHRLRAAIDPAGPQIQRLTLELDSLRNKLSDRELQLADVQRQLNTSRFPPNAPRALTTVNDAPMSYEVERGYQRDLKFAADRVKELELAYAQLLAAGHDDRERVKSLTKEVSSREEDIARLNQVINRTEKEREEQRQLFQGVSRTRGEEARMSLVAVKQLESRVQGLAEQLSAKTLECENNAKSLRVLYQMWNAAEDKLKTVKDAHRELDMEHRAYKSIYNSTLSDELFIVQDELVRALTQSDQREATVMIQRQQLDDVEVARNLSLKYCKCFSHCKLVRFPCRNVNAAKPLL